MDIDESRPPAQDDADNRKKIGAAYFSLALVGLLLWPVQENWKDAPHDDFPLTYYPMFSAKREAVETFYYVTGLDEQGHRHFVPYTIIGTGGLNQVRKQVNRMVREGQAVAVATAVADKLATMDRAPWSQIATVEVCRGKYAVDAWFRGGRSPVKEEIKASRAVERAKS